MDNLPPEIRGQIVRNLQTCKFSEHSENKSTHGQPFKWESGPLFPWEKPRFSAMPCSFKDLMPHTWSFSTTLLSSILSFALTNRANYAIAAPILDEILNSILRHVRPAPWQTKTDQNLVTNDYQQLRLYAKSIFRLAANFRPWAVRKTAPKEPYRFARLKLSESGRSVAETHAYPQRIPDPTPHPYAVSSGKIEGLLIRFRKNEPGMTLCNLRDVNKNLILLQYDLGSDEYEIRTATTHDGTPVKRGTSSGTKLVTKLFGGMTMKK